MIGSHTLHLLFLTFLLCLALTFGQNVKINTKMFGADPNHFGLSYNNNLKEPSIVLSFTDEKLLQTASMLDEVKYDVSSVCLNHTEMIIEGITNRTNWALRMIDAMGKPSSNLLDLHINWLGSWEECTGVKVDLAGRDDDLIGKYCTAVFPIGGSGQTLLQPGLALRIGMCLPESCSNQDASVLVNVLVGLIPLNITMSPGYALCQENHLELSGKATAVIVVLSFLLAVIIVATAFDIVNKHFTPAAKNTNAITPNGKVYGTFKSEDHSSQENGHILNGQALAQGNEHLPNHYKKPEPEIKKTGLLGNVLLSFSVYTNAAKILNTNQPAGTLTNINGIRFISMLWVVLGHTYAFGLNATDNITTFLPNVLTRLSFQAISNATVAVDTFFVLSGLLVAYLTLKELEKRGGAKHMNWAMFYFHRFWRLTPPYMLVIMLYVPTLKYWSSGPIWPQQGVDVDECKDTWWQNMLYINNLVNTDKMCMAWSWYLANDMQFYVLSPLMLVPLYYSPLWGSISCLAFVLLNFITTGVISKQHELGSNFILGDNGGDAFDLTYIKPWCRIGPYAVGIYVGYILYKTKCKVKMSKFLNAIGWVTATVVALLVLYGLYSSDGQSTLGVDASALYNATARTAWGMSIAWVIFSCATGYGGPVNTLLSWRAIIPLSRLTYCAYLIHPVVMYVYYFSRRTLMRWYDLEMAYLFLGNLSLAYAAAFIISLAFESPMMGLEKTLLGRGKRS